MECSELYRELESCLDYIQGERGNRSVDSLNDTREKKACERAMQRALSRSPCWPSISAPTGTGDQGSPSQTCWVRQKFIYGSFKMVEAAVLECLYREQGLPNMCRSAAYMQRDARERNERKDKISYYRHYGDVQSSSPAEKILDQPSAFRKERSTS
ncbi:hypothetical protein EJB05_41165, partial [Eragrostis curvula]